MVEDRVTLTLSNQPVQIVEYVLDTEPGLSIRVVVKVDPDQNGARVAVNHSVGVVTNTELLLPSLIATVILLAAIPWCTGQLPNPSN
ncbi:hypothetical protein D9M69_674730 [compost metagenome]